MGAGELPGRLGGGVTGDQWPPGLWEQWMLPRNFFFFGCPRGGGITVCGGAEPIRPRARFGQHLCSSWDLCVRGQKPSSNATRPLTFLGPPDLPKSYLGSHLSSMTETYRCRSSQSQGAGGSLNRGRLARPRGQAAWLRCVARSGCQLWD